MSVPHICICGGGVPSPSNQSHHTQDATSYYNVAAPQNQKHLQQTNNAFENQKNPHSYDFPLKHDESSGFLPNIPPGSSISYGYFIHTPSATGEQPGWPPFFPRPSSAPSTRQNYTETTQRFDPPTKQRPSQEQINRLPSSFEDSYSSPLNQRQSKRLQPKSHVSYSSPPRPRPSISLIVPSQEELQQSWHGSPRPEPPEIHEKSKFKFRKPANKNYAEAVTNKNQEFLVKKIDFGRQQLPASQHKGRNQKMKIRIADELGYNDNDQSINRIISDGQPFQDKFLLNPHNTRVDKSNKEETLPYINYMEDEESHILKTPYFYAKCGDNVLKLLNVNAWNLPGYEEKRNENRMLYRFEGSDKEGQYFDFDLFPRPSYLQLEKLHGHVNPPFNTPARSEDIESTPEYINPQENSYAGLYDISEYQRNIDNLKKNTEPSLESSFESPGKPMFSSTMNPTNLERLGMSKINENSNEFQSLRDSSSASNNSFNANVGKMRVTDVIHSVLQNKIVNEQKNKKNKTF